LKAIIRSGLIFIMNLLELTTKFKMEIILLRSV